MYFSGNRDEVVYIMISIKIYIDKDMNIGHYFCDVLDYNTETWWNYYDDTITKYSRYLVNVYGNLSRENEQKKGKKYYEWIRYDCVNVIHKTDALVYSTYPFCTGKPESKDIENIKDRIADFKIFKENFGKIKSYVKRFRLSFHCRRIIWTLLLKIT